MIVKLSPRPTPRSPESLQENPQFFVPTTSRREFNVLGPLDPPQARDTDFKPRWWPGEDISESR